MDSLAGFSCRIRSSDFLAGAARWSHWIRSLDSLIDSLAGSRTTFSHQIPLLAIFTPWILSLILSLILLLDSLAVLALWIHLLDSL